jgi:hypothetical protein
MYLQRKRSIRGEGSNKDARKAVVGSKQFASVLNTNELYDSNAYIFSQAGMP